MTTENLTPDPLRDARYGVAMSASLGLFDTAGWTPPPAGECAEFDDSEDERPRGNPWALVLWPALLVVLVAALFLLRASGVQ